MEMELSTAGVNNESWLCVEGLLLASTPHEHICRLPSPPPHRPPHDVIAERPSSPLPPPVTLTPSPPLGAAFDENDLASFPADAMQQLVGAIDQGTSSSRFLVFDLESGELVAQHQIEVKQLYPQSGWVEMDPLEIYSTVVDCMAACCGEMRRAGVNPGQIRAIGLCNQRETTVVWDRVSGHPLHNAIVWLDTRTSQLAEQCAEKVPNKSRDHFKPVTGLPIHPYFSALKLVWLLDNVPAVREAERRGTLLFGTVDTWLLWKMTGQHVTDVTNASRTLLFDLNTLQWSDEMCKFFGVPCGVLPAVKSSSELYGTLVEGPLKGVPIAGCLGDQQSALVGHSCLRAGEAKSTYGTGTFLLCNIGERPVVSNAGLLTTVAFQLGPKEACLYALEGSGSIGGNVVRFLRDNLNLLSHAGEIEELAASVETTNGVYFVPCFNGLFTPYWDSDARAIICGLNQSATRAHIALAALKAVAFQTAEMVEAVEADLTRRDVISALKIDGGMTTNELFNQILADVTGLDIRCPLISETSGWGAAIAAGIGAGLITPNEVAARNGRADNEKTYSAHNDDDTRQRELRRWRDAIKHARAFGSVA